MAEAYIIDAVRTPVGKRGGGLSEVHPADLGAHVLNALMDRTGVDPSAVEDVYFGCVDAIGPQAGDIARTARTDHSIAPSSGIVRITALAVSDAVVESLREQWTTRVAGLRAGTNDTAAAAEVNDSGNDDLTAAALDQDGIDIDDNGEIVGLS